MNMYIGISAVKALVGIITLRLTYNNINIYEDPFIGIGLGCLGVFMVCRGISFFIFLGVQKRQHKKDDEKIIKDSYKLSLLFGIYGIINVLFIAVGRWNILIGIILLGGCIWLQYSLFNEQRAHD